MACLTSLFGEATLRCSTSCARSRGCVGPSYRDRSCLITLTAMECELCTPTDLLLENEQAYVQFEREGLSRGHVIVVPRRHVANFFQMSSSEHEAVNQLLRDAHALITERFSPDGFNMGVNIGKAAGQNR